MFMVGKEEQGRNDLLSVCSPSLWEDGKWIYEKLQSLPYGVGMICI